MTSAVRYYWLLDVTVPGAGAPASPDGVLRYSTEPHVVTTAAGDDLDYAAGLGDLELGAGDVDVDVEISDAAVDWPVIGPLLDGARVVLRRWREGTVLERAEVYARGTATGTEWGSSFEPVSFGVAAVATLPPMPHPTARVTTITTEEIDNTQSIPTGQAGMYYPVVFGFPGRYIRQYVGVDDSGLLEDFLPVVPCPMRILFKAAASVVDSEIVVSADPSAFLPGTVLLREDGLGYEEEETVLTSTDALGRRIGVATLVDSFRIFSNADDGPVYLAAFGPDDGGVLAPRDAYDVVRYVLSEWGGDTVDWARIPEVADALRGYMVDTWVNTDVGPGGVWSWLVEALGVGEADATESAGLPVAIRQGANGRYLVPLRYSVEAARSVRTIDVSRGEASRVSGVRTRGEPANLVELRYGYDLSAWAGETVAAPAVLVVTTTIGTSSLTAVAPNALATASVSRYGARPIVVDVPWTWDHATALRVGQDVLARDALPWRYVQYRVPEEWGLREGMTVRLVDEELALDEYALVNGPPYVGADGMTITLRMSGVP